MSTPRSPPPSSPPARSLGAAASIACYGLPVGTAGWVVSLPLGRWAWGAQLAVPLVAALVVHLLERRYPFQPAWNEPRSDVAADLLHTLVNVGSNQLAVLLVAAASGLGVGSLGLWPASQPFALQLVLAIVVSDLGQYWVHRLSHRWDRLWRYHAVHHSPERLYLLNGERRHPVNHWLDILLGPGLVAVAGGSRVLLVAYGTTIVVHLAIQHSNIDLTLGPLRRLVAGPQTHRLHHLRERPGDVNLGALTHVWDHVFGTFADPVEPVSADAVGLAEAEVPPSYLGQLLFPWRRRRRPTAQKLVSAPPQ